MIKATAKKILEDYVALNENAYIYKKSKAFKLKNYKLLEIFRNISTDKIGQYLLNVRNKKHTIEGEDITYSACVFKYSNKPSILLEALPGWEEIKIAYLFIFEFHDYIIISKKNISDVVKAIGNIETLDYTMLSELFLTDASVFEKFSLSNLNANDNAMRNKTLESQDLKSSMSPHGTNSYVLNNLRIKTGDEVTALSLSSSRVNKFGKKKQITQLMFWAKSVVDKIRTYMPISSFLKSFATPISYEDQRHLLIPNGILFSFSQIYADFDRQLIQSFYYVIDEDRIRNIDLIKVLKTIETLCRIKVKDDNYIVENPYSEDIFLRMNKKSITIVSEKLNRIKIRFNDGNETDLVNYINYKQSFIVSFEEADHTYNKKKLFKDNRLLGNIDAFMQVFEPLQEMEDIVSEKGKFTAGQTSFSDTSVFGLVEAKLVNDFDHVICDDLGKEWADHIAIGPSDIIYIHSKYKDVQFSATAFQDIVGQALKNSGNLMPQDFQLTSKTGIWSSDYKNDGVVTSIARIRKGVDVDDAILAFKNARGAVRLNREIWLCLNFISKANLFDKLDRLRRGEAFTERNEAIQILWIISSLVFSCKELGINVRIYCKP